jgi:hypothetical protein
MLFILLIIDIILTINILSILFKKTFNNTSSTLFFTTYNIIRNIILTTIGHFLNQFSNIPPQMANNNINGAPSIRYLNLLRAISIINDPYNA